MDAWQAQLGKSRAELALYILHMAAPMLIVAASDIEACSRPVKHEPCGQA
jgi:hypothetical protein